MSTPVVQAAYLITSSDVKNGSRDKMIRAIDAVVSGITLGGSPPVRVSAFDPENVRAILAQSEGAPIVEIDAAKVGDAAMRPHARPMHVRHVSNGLKHLHALKAIGSDATAPTCRFNLVMEDDTVFGESMTAVLAKIVEAAPADADIVFLSLPSNRPQPPPPGEIVFEDPTLVFKDVPFPSCDAYAVTRAGAEKLAKAFLPLFFPAAGQITLMIRRGVVKSYVAVPNAFVDGSKVGFVPSLMDANNHLLWNNNYVQMDGLVRRSKDPYDDASRERFEALWAEQPFKEQPDAMVLRGDHLSRSGRHREAEDVYASALTVYEREGCVINQSSEFLKRYMALFRHF
jgi:GR25 family glycosyltransferase involved in LPS biosynthesis